MACAGPRLVHNRVDALWLAYRCELTDDARRTLQRTVDTNARHGRSAVTVGGLTWECKGGSESHWNLRREEHLRAMIDLNAPGATFVEAERNGEIVALAEPGWTVAIIFYASHLAEVGLEAAMREGDAVARAFGRVHERRLRRLDLAADIERWELADCDRRCLVRRSRVRTRIDPPHRTVGREVHEVAAPGVTLDLAVAATAHEARQLTGLTMGRGDVVARIYDKREELRAMSPHKKDAEEARWQAAGWAGDTNVTRVEFQLRGEVLRELGCRSLDSVHDPETGELTTLPAMLPRIWTTCLRWVRLVKRQKTKTGKPVPITRCPEDDRWIALRAASWGYSAPIKRKRERGGASSAQALGSMLSVAGARGKLTGKLSENVNTWKVGGVDRLQRALSMIASWSVDLVAVDMIDRFGSPEEAGLHLAVLWNAARARFARIYEEKEMPPWDPVSNRESTGVTLSQVLNSTD
jgi:hypothetical protein